MACLTPDRHTLMAGLVLLIGACAPQLTLPDPSVPGIATPRASAADDGQPAYRAFDEPQRADWRAVNRVVGDLGGHGGALEDPPEDHRPKSEN